MSTKLTFNRIHKNGWLSWKLAGVPGALFVDRRMLSAETLANPPQTIDVEIPGLAQPGEGATEAQAAKLAKKQEMEAKKAERAQAAAAKAQARLAKLQESAAKAKAAAEAAQAKASGQVAPATEGQGTEAQPTM